MTGVQTCALPISALDELGFHDIRLGGLVWKVGLEDSGTPESIHVALRASSSCGCDIFKRCPRRENICGIHGSSSWILMMSLLELEYNGEQGTRKAYISEIQEI